MFQVRTVKIDEYDKILEFYDLLIESMEGEESRPKWKKRIYPTEEFLINSIQRQELFVGVMDENFVAAAVVNHNCAKGYEEIEWGINASQEEISVIHALGISHEYQRQGIAKRMVEEIIHISKENHQKVIRLDVLKSNVAAQKLYSSVGFQYKDTVEMFYEDTGATNFMLYELIL